MTTTTRIWLWVLAVVVALLALLAYGGWTRLVAYQDTHCSNADWQDGPHPEWC